MLQNLRKIDLLKVPSALKHMYTVHVNMNKLHVVKIVDNRTKAAFNDFFLNWYMYSYLITSQFSCNTYWQIRVGIFILQKGAI